MSQEIVSRLLAQKRKMLFESDTVNKEEVLEDITDEEFKDRIPEDDPEPEELEVKEIKDELEDTENTDMKESATVQYAPCPCGSTDVVIENGVAICNDCGREMKVLSELGEPLVPKKDTKKVVNEDMDSDKLSTLRVALKYWNQGEYMKAMKFCKQNGVSDKEFAYFLVKSLNEEEDKSEEDSEDIQESIEIRPGVEFKNAGNTWKILAYNNEYVLVYSSEKKLQPYVVAWHLDKNNGSWAQGHYFDDKDKALKFLKSKGGILSQLKEDADLEVIAPEEKSNLEKNIIYAVQTPVSTAKKPSLDAAIVEAMSGKKTYYVNYRETEGKFKGKYVDKAYTANSKEEAENMFKKEHPNIRRQDYKVTSPSSDMKESTRSKHSIQEALGSDAPLKLEDFIHYGESQAKKFSLGMDRFAMKTRENYCRDAYRAIVRCWNTPQREKNPNFTERMVNAAFSGGLSHWFAEEIKVEQNASSQWRQSMTKYLKQKFNVKM